MGVARRRPHLAPGRPLPLPRPGGGLRARRASTSPRAATATPWHSGRRRPSPRGWSRWESLGGIVTAGSAATSWGYGRIDVFARGTDGAFWHRWFEGGA